MALANTPLTAREQAMLIARLMENQPDVSQGDIDILVRWAENIRVATGLLDSIEAGEIKVSIKNNKVLIDRKG
ncbi:MAG: hypothetical protein PHI12_07570 [Dehalococcoidales bacterium]|nr:hypothetical protein [Dehalococcoidales bacterium]